MPAGAPESTVTAWATTVRCAVRGDTVTDAASPALAPGAITMSITLSLITSGESAMRVPSSRPASGNSEASTITCPVTSLMPRAATWRAMSRTTVSGSVGSGWPP